MTRSTSTVEILKRLRAAGSAANVAGMARYGIRPAKAYGVATPVIRAIAKDHRHNPELAPALWSTGVLEARCVAALIADPQQIPEAEIERWVRDFDCWSVCDSACIALLWKTPFAWSKVREWSRREPEYERRAAFALLAALAVHDKKATDKQFLSALRLVRRAAVDDRNFVKKAVNWALRQIGKRNAALREAAIEVAEALIATESRAARWIGHDAVRELRRKTLL
ncbi:MAG: DNA alkylation repair protein [Bryobacteraceae bacterium]|jgi:3-methyladenine DNA glycosylase AlkD